MPASLGLVFKNNNQEILLVRRRDMPVWVFPGGGIDPGESPAEAAIREVKEETGYDVKIVKPVGRYSFRNGLFTFNTFECVIAGGEKRLSNESKKVEFFPINKPPFYKTPYFASFINDALLNDPSLISRPVDEIPITYWLKGLLNPWLVLKYLLVRVGIHWNT